VFFKEDGEPVLMAQVLGASGLDEMAAMLAQDHLPFADLALPGRRFYRFTNTLGETVGFGGIEGQGPDRLIRSIVVCQDLRGKRHGKAVAQTLERQAGADGAERLHLLTTAAALFFEQLGYEKRDRAEAPAEIAATEQFRTLCSSSAAYLTKRVRTAW
jgi:amino-acid N-acetyltransferase